VAKIGELVVKIGADASGLNKELKGAQKNVQGFAKSMESIGTKMKSIGATMTAAITLPVIGAAAASFKLASDYQESLNKIEVAFQDNADEVKRWSKTTLRSFGIAGGTALDMAAKYGDMATGMGLNTKEAAKMSTELVGLAGDLASFKNISIDIADTALTSIFTGETESLKQLGIIMTQANLEQFALSRGIRKSMKDMTQAEQVQLRYAYVVAMSKNSVGDFARTSGGAANQMRIFQETLKELGATFGENLLPVITPLIQGLNELLKRFGEMNPAMQKVIVIGGLLVAALGPLLMILGSLATALPLIAGAFAALIGPIGAVIAIVGVVVVAFKKLWDTSPAFRQWAAHIGADIYNFFITKINMAIDAVNGLIWALNKITGWEVPNIGKKATIDNSAGFYDKRTMGATVTGQAGRKGLGFGGYASGTNWHPGGLAWVGEQGPELVNLPRGAAVLNNRDSMAAANQSLTIGGTVRVEGVNNMSQLIGVAEVVAKQIEQGDRRLAGRVRVMPSMA